MLDELERENAALLAELEREKKKVKYLEYNLGLKAPNFARMLQTIERLKCEIQGLKEDLGSLRVLEAFMRSGVIKDLGLKDDPDTQAILRRFFKKNLERALANPETLVLSSSPTSERTTSAAEGPENERSRRAS